MYTKDKAQRITLRLNEQQFEFVKANADILGVSPSEFLRIVVNASMSSLKNAQEKLKSQGKTFSSVADEIINKAESEGVGRENDKADSNNLV